MGNKAKQKGDREERKVVNLHRALGFDCERTLEAGARSDGSATWDIDLYLYGSDEAAVIGECKHRESFPEYIWKMLGENDFLTIRKNGRERLYVLPERFWLELIKN